MIVRPTAGPSFQARRSQSTPPRRRSNSTGSVPAEPAPPLPTATHMLVQALHNTTKHASDPLLRTSSAKRKLFRLKRPSNSQTDRRALGEGQGAPADIVPASPTAPPRPPRNPARGTLRPSTSSGEPDVSTPSLPNDVLAPARQRKSSGVSTDWEFPLPRGSEFPLQRKKSKSRKPSAARNIQDESAKNDVPFSTLDRAILEELRQKIRAREEQFVIRSGKKYHAFSPEEVPYPRSYDRQVVDLDVWDNLWQQQLGGSITMHVFETPPARVLELGCGTGTWILNAAREWKDSHFVGVDVVPLHPDLVQVGSIDLASRITWVQANFLERLPFPNEEFDYVRLVRIARGVPEDKWDGLLEEITRVMKPGGAFEMWEEDLRFPGCHRESVSIHDAPDPRHATPPTPPRTESSHSSEQERPTPLPAHALPLHRSIAFSYSFDDVYRVKHAMLGDIHSPRPLRPMPSRTNLNVASTPILLRSIEKPPINPHDHSLLETIYDEMHAARFINLEPVALLANLLPLHLRDVRAPPPIVVNFPQPPAPPSFGEETDSPFSFDRTTVALGQLHMEDHKYSRSTVELSPPGLLHGPQVAVGTPFVALDTTRYSGFSPAALRRSAPLPGHASSQLEHVSSGTDAEVGSTSTPKPTTARRSMNPLPNKTVNFDPRSINLLLALRVQEVLACAEPMWDWVIDFQETTARNAKATPSRRTSDYLTLKSFRARRHPKQDALMDLTREQFEELLRRFELDMKNRMFLSIAVEDRLGWLPFTPTTTEEREIFESMCAAWAEYEHRLASGPSPRARGFLESSPRLAHQSELEREGVPADVDRYGPSSPPRNSDGSARRTSESVQTGAAAGSLSEDEPPPASRTGRIFVAWKA